MKATKDPGTSWQELGERPVVVATAVPVAMAVREERTGQWAARVTIGAMTITVHAGDRDAAIKSAERKAQAALGRLLRAG